MASSIVLTHQKALIVIVVQLQSALGLSSISTTQDRRKKKVVMLSCLIIRTRGNYRSLTLLDHAYLAHFARPTVCVTKLTFLCLPSDDE